MCVCARVCVRVCVCVCVCACACACVTITINIFNAFIFKYKQTLKIDKTILNIRLWKEYSVIMLLFADFNLWEFPEQSESLVRRLVLLKN